MKKYLLINLILIICFNWGGVNAQDNPVKTNRKIPPALESSSNYVYNSATSRTGNCNGYAVSRAFGKNWIEYEQILEYIDPITGKPVYTNGDVLDRYHAANLFINNYEIPDADIGGYFEEISGSTNAATYQIVESGDIIGIAGSAGHVVYVKSVDRDTLPIQAKDISIVGKDNTYTDHTTPETIQDSIDRNSALKGNWIFDLWRRKDNFEATFATNLELDANNSRGTVNVDNTVHPSGYKVTDKKWGGAVSFSRDSALINHNNRKREFDDWETTDNGDFIYDPNYDDGTHNIHLLHAYDEQPTFTARYLKYFNITVQNQFVGLSNQGDINIDGIHKSMSDGIPFVQEKLEDSYIRLAPVDYQVINGIKYTFDHWSDGETDSVYTFKVTGDKSISAVFVGKPIVVPNLLSTSPIGQMIKLTWTAHPNSNCSYEVWRYKKDQHNPSNTSTDSLTTLAHSATSWTDPLFKKTHGYTHYLLTYDVRAVYSVENTTADPDFRCNAFGNISLWSVNGNDSTQVSPESAGEEKFTEPLKVYPNPFNPVTTVRFYLAEGSRVSAVIYDIRGSKVIELINGFKEAGSYSVTWGGRDSNGANVASGLYFLRYVSAENQLVKRLILMK